MLKLMKKNQKGLALIETLLIILILVIIGFGGYYVWHSQKQSNSTLSTAASTSQAASSQSALLSATVDKTLSLKYPSTWHLVQTNQSAATSDTPSNTVITSPDGNTTVTLVGGLSGIGGGCDPSQGQTLTDVDKTTLANQPAYAFLSYRTSDGLVNFAMVDASTAAKTAVGSNYCDVAFSGLLQNYLDGLGTVGIGYKPFTASSGGPASASSSDYKTFTHSADYRLALDIVKSIKKIGG